jgi:hypothetical protein
MAGWKSIIRPASFLPSITDFHVVIRSLITSFKQDSCGDFTRAQVHYYFRDSREQDLAESPFLF